MNESLKSIRLVHNLIIVSCAALTILASSKQPFQNIFDAALKEVELILPTYETIRAKEVELVLNFYQKNGPLDVLNEIFEGLPLEPVGNYEWDIQHDKLEEFNDRLASTNGAWSFTNMNVYHIKLQIQTEQLRAWYESCAETARVRNRQLKKWTIVWDGRDPEVTIALHDSTGQAGAAGGVLLRETEIKDNYPHARELVLRNSLVRVVNGDTITFPLLKEVWDVVKPLTIHEAKDALLRNSRSSKEQSAKPLSIFGLTIESRDASLFGPILLISLLLYLLAQIKHLASVGSKDFNTLITFPWVGLFDNVIGKMMVFCTILIFPLFSTIMIVKVSNYSVGSKWLVISIYSVVLIWLGSYLLRTVYLLKQELRHKFIEKKEDS